MNTLNSRTSEDITVNSNCTVTGSYSVFKNLYDSPSGLNGLNSIKLIVTDTSLTAGEVNTLNGYTSKTIDVSLLTTLTGSAVNMNTAYASSGIIGLGNEAVTLDTTNATLDASVLNTLNNYTTGIINANEVNTLNGTSAACSDVYIAAENGNITNLGNEAVTITNIHTLDELKTINNGTTGAITLNNLNKTLVGLDSDITEALHGITNYAGNITLTNTTLNASSLITIRDLTTGTINARIIDSLVGTTAQLNQAHALSNVSNLGDEACILSDTTLAVADLNTLDSHTSGLVNAATVTTLTGSAADMNTAYTSSGISDLGNESCIISNEKDDNIDATILSFIGGATTGTVTVTNAVHISGTTAEVTDALVTDATKVEVTDATVTIDDVQLYQN